MEWRGPQDSRRVMERESEGDVMAVVLSQLRAVMGWVYESEGLFSRK
jgi:hypothetical protein